MTSVDYNWFARSSAPQPPPESDERKPLAEPDARSLLRMLEQAARQRKSRLEELEKMRVAQSEYTELVDTLRELPARVEHKVLVPFGKLALFPGKLVHTNEVMVLLGDNYFALRSAEQAAGVASRRAEYVAPQVEQLEADVAELNERIEQIRAYGQAGGTDDGTFEIREPYEEEEGEAEDGRWMGGSATSAPAGGLFGGEPDSDDDTDEEGDEMGPAAGGGKTVRFEDGADEKRAATAGFAPSRAPSKAVAARSDGAASARELASLLPSTSAAASSAASAAAAAARRSGGGPVTSTVWRTERDRGAADGAAETKPAARSPAAGGGAAFSDRVIEREPPGRQSHPAPRPGGAAAGVAAPAAAPDVGDAMETEITMREVARAAAHMQQRRAGRASAAEDMAEEAAGAARDAHDAGDDEEDGVTMSRFKANRMRRRQP